MRAWAPAVLIALAAGCRRAAPPRSEEPQQRLEGFALSQSTLGSPAWDLEARSATLSEGDRVAQLNAPALAFYKNKKKVSTVTARAGIVRTDTYDVTLSSDVVVHSLEDQSALMTSELRYSSQRKLFLTDKDVLVKRPGGTLRGTGLEASPDLSDIRVFNQRTVVEKDAR